MNYLRMHSIKTKAIKLTEEESIREIRRLEEKLGFNKFEFSQDSDLRKTQIDNSLKSLKHIENKRHIQEQYLNYKYGFNIW